MKLIALITLGFALTFTALGQAPAPMSLGEIPEDFELPEDMNSIRFTSHESPVFTAPVYPAKRLKRGIENVVEVDIYVATTGKVVQAVLSLSSGDKAFDEAALESAMKAQFPAGYATVDGEPSDFKLSVPYYFLLSADPEQYWHTRLELARVQKEYNELMTQFQELMAGQTSADSEGEMATTKKSLEVKIAAAKNLHKVLAEKKESAIARINSVITETRAHIEGDDAQMRDPNWRPSYAANNTEVKVGLPQAGIMTLSSQKSDKPILEQLTSEIKIKRRYM